MNVFEYKSDLKTHRLLSYIWKKRGKAMRGDIIRDFNLSRVTVITAVDRLLQGGVVSETDAPNGRQGRQPKALSICGDQCFAVGISIVGHHAEICAVDAGMCIIGSEETKNLPMDGDAQLRLLLQSVNTLLARHALDRKRLVGIGVSLPGMIDHKVGIVRRSSSFTGGEKAPIIPFWQKQFDKPCLILEHSSALALTEKEWGAASELSTFLYFDGAGVGMFLDGRIFMGSQNYGGEIGMLKLRDAPAGEADGRFGTLNMLTRFRDLRFRTDEAIAKGAATILTAWLREGRPLSREMIADAAVQGDALCRGLVEEMFQVYAEMIINLNYLFNPEAIFLWPWTAQCSDVSLDIVQRRLAVCKLINPDIHTVVLPARHGPEALARGIAMLPLNKFFDG